MFARLLGLKTISPRDLLQLMQSQAVTAVDVNAPASWLRARVPGAVNLDPAGYSDRDLPSDKHALVVFYCSNLLCRKAPSAALRAKRMGFANVRVMSAGIAGWLDAGLPVESGAAATAASSS